MKALYASCAFDISMLAAWIWLAFFNGREPGWRLLVIGAVGAHLIITAGRIAALNSNKTPTRKRENQ